jgi:hypothetical protein
MPTTGEWCAPTAELSNAQLGALVQRTRRTTAIPNLVPLDDPWFEDSKPVLIHAPKPAADPPAASLAPTWRAAGHRPRMAIRRITGAIAALAKPVYPTAPSSYGGLLPVLALIVCAAVAAAYLLV